ncbi:hypothetical protein HLV37_01405 [Eggerthellaceae bacterium zg-1084]|uniref:hypothetical protein n=1 Tax=Berryella wangjianweii TaxID=2734634 RepID=UPI001551AC0C|nr:hypothetical protein [Berryella wangjianweii]NPD30539.1 hypothetical protein [Berryella wangjianweii]
MPLTKPDAIASDAFRSAKWDELTAGRDFAESDAPTLALLCQWHAVIARCMDDLDVGGELPAVAYQNDMGDLRAMPQLSTMKQASVSALTARGRAVRWGSQNASGNCPDRWTDVLWCMADRRTPMDGGRP